MIVPALDGRYACPGPWVDQAACSGATHLMVMPNGRGTATTRKARAHIARARSICHSCPVIGECLEWALTDPDPAVHMVAGGLIPSERNRIRERR